MIRAAGGNFRQLRPGELPLYLNHLLRLDPDSRQSRFEHAMDDAAIQAHCLRLVQSGGRVVGAFSDHILRGAVEMSHTDNAAIKAIELAFSVETDFRGQGFANKLMDKALELINPQPALMFCRDDNGPMVALANKYGARTWQDEDFLALVIVTDDTEVDIPEGAFIQEQPEEALRVGQGYV